MLYAWLLQSLHLTALLIVMLCIQAAIFLPLAYLFPSNPKQPIFRKDMISDLLFLFFAILIIEPANAAFLILLHTKYHVNALQHPYHAEGSPGGWTLAAYLFVTIALVDFLQYWVHRALLHSRRLWKVHAIHHCSVNVDWLSNNRAHPVNYVLLNTVVFDALNYLGFNPSLSLWGTVFYMLNACLTHANLNWTYGPLRHVITSPVFHRWHHTAYDRGGNKNFATVFSIYDHLFGTFYMPKGETPGNFGTTDRIGQGFLNQMLYPFRRT